MNFLSGRMKYKIADTPVYTYIHIYKYVRVQQHYTLTCTCFIVFVCLLKMDSVCCMLEHK